MKYENVKSNIPKLNICCRRSVSDGGPRRISPIHYHDELELLPIYEGSFACRVNGKDYVANAGEVIFVGGGVPHETFSLTASVDSGLLQFRESDYLNTEIRKIIKYSVKLQNTEGAPVHILRSPMIFSAVDSIMRECEEKCSAYEILARAEILRIIGLLYRMKILSDGEEVFASPAIQKILPALTYINQHYSENLTLEEVSSLLGFDKSYFCRIFRAATGATFTEYLNFVRVCKAEKRLSATQDSILDISSDVGFCSVSYFNKIFKKYKSCSPSFYRHAKYCNNI